MVSMNSQTNPNTTFTQRDRAEGTQLYPERFLRFSKLKSGGLAGDYE